MSAKWAAVNRSLRRLMLLLAIEALALGLFFFANDDRLWDEVPRRLKGLHSLSWALFASAACLFVMAALNCFRSGRDE